MKVSRTLSGILAAATLFMTACTQGRYVKQEDLEPGKMKPGPTSTFTMQDGNNIIVSCQGHGMYGYTNSDEFSHNPNLKASWLTDGRGDHITLAISYQTSKAKGTMVIKNYETQYPKVLFAEGTRIPVDVAASIGLDLATLCTNTVKGAGAAKLGVGESIKTPDGTISVENGSLRPDPNLKRLIDKYGYRPGYGKGSN